MSICVITLTLILFFLETTVIHHIVPYFLSVYLGGPYCKINVGMFLFQIAAGDSLRGNVVKINICLIMETIQVG